MVQTVIPPLMMVRPLPLDIWATALAAKQLIEAFASFFWALPSQFSLRSQQKPPFLRALRRDGKLTQRSREPPGHLPLDIRPQIPHLHPIGVPVPREHV